ncbi:ABC transporter permease [Sphaerisporangium dianthi]|uniref:ABC transporter permease n=1 Tax=Sphaerisporangium dianthi TaxID=1436120 RepID=A0ABV9CDE4_9ACTN
MSTPSTATPGTATPGTATPAPAARARTRDDAATGAPAPGAPKARTASGDPAGTASAPASRVATGAPASGALAGPAGAPASGDPTGTAGAPESGDAAGAAGAPEGARPARPSRARAALRLLGSELGLTFRKPRNIAMLAVLACVPAVLGVVLRAFGGELDGEAPSLITQVAGNGLMLTFAALSLLLVMLLPLAIAVVAGDAIAGEAGGGTLRYLLTAPAGRTRLLAVKFANITVFALVATSVVAAGALITGFVLFPVGPITLLSGSTISIGEGLLRVLIVTGYTAAGLAALGAVALAVSTLTEVPIGAIAATVVAVVFSHVLGAIPQLAPAQPYFLTSWWASFDGALRDPVATDVMTQGLLVYAAYILVALSIAWARFTSRDITS